MTEIEIRTTTATEPMLTLSQVTALLREAAALERAGRPIVLHGPEKPVTAPYGAPVAVTVPMPPARPAAPATGRRMFTRAELIGYCGVSAGATAASAGIASLFSSSPIVWGAACLGGMFVSFGAAIASNRDDDRRIAASGR